MRHGVYLSTDEFLNLDPNVGEVDRLLTDPTLGLADIQSVFVVTDDPETSNPLQGKNDRIASHRTSPIGKTFRRRTRTRSKSESRRM